MTDMDVGAVFNMITSSGRVLNITNLGVIELDDDGYPISMPMGVRGWYSSLYKDPHTGEDALMSAVYVDTLSSYSYYKIAMLVTGDPFFGTDCCSSNPPNEIVCMSGTVALGCMHVGEYEYDTHDQITNYVPYHVPNYAIALMDAKQKSSVEQIIYYSAIGVAGILGLKMLKVI